jgi:hypothetical protein
MRNPHPESSVYHELWNDGYVAATADCVEVMQSNCKQVRDYLRSIDGEIKAPHVRRAMAIALVGKEVK